MPEVPYFKCYRSEVAKELLAANMNAFLLLWQIAYTEIHVTDTFWPAFGKEELMTAIYEYQNRERRFGKISEQLKVDNG